MKPQLRRSRKAVSPRSSSASAAKCVASSRLAPAVSSENPAPIAGPPSTNGPNWKFPARSRPKKTPRRVTSNPPSGVATSNPRTSILTKFPAFGPNGSGPLWDYSAHTFSQPRLTTRMTPSPIKIAIKRAARLSILDGCEAFPSYALARRRINGSQTTQARANGNKMSHLVESLASFSIPSANTIPHSMDAAARTATMSDRWLTVRLPGPRPRVRVRSQSLRRRRLPSQHRSL